MTRHLREEDLPAFLELVKVAQTEMARQQDNSQEQTEQQEHEGKITR
jgi:hypothetical protein